MYQKLFPIEYNNKNFMIFIDENHRKTFLEINNEGKYEYPLLEDFLALNKIYNQKDPFICYAQKYTFKECVKALKGATLNILSVVIMLNSMPSALATEIKADIQDESVILTSSSDPITKEEIEITDLKDLDKYLGKKEVTKEIVLEAINSNSNLSPKYKRIAIKLLNAITESNPNADLRIFYENIKTMHSVEYTIEEFRKAFPDAPGAGAQYNAKTNTITSIDEVPIELLYHEMAHAFHYLYREQDNKMIYRKDNNTALDESMTNKVASLVTPVAKSYEFSDTILEYLNSRVNFSITDYNNKGTDDLISKLKAQYPNIDFDYISNTLKTINEYLIYQGKTVAIDQCEEFLNELFSICLQEVSIQNGYEPFSSFAKVMYNSRNPELVFDYLDLYNAKLQKIGYSKIIPKSDALAKFRIYKNATGLGYEDANFFPIIFQANEDLKIINKDGSTSIKSKHHGFASTFDFPSIISSNMFSSYDEFGTPKFWSKLNNDIKLISPHNYSPIPIYQDGEYLFNVNLNNLYIQVGITKDSQIGYIISNKNSELIYSSHDEFLSISNKISLPIYVRQFSEYISQLDLSDILNVEYLTSFQAKTSSFNNFSIENKNLIFRTSMPNLDVATDICLNNKLLFKSKLSDLYISIGEVDNGIGFILSNSQGKIAYQSHSKITKISDSINFYSYVNKLTTRLDLASVLNKEYLISFQNRTQGFNNIEILNDQIIIDDTPRVEIESIKETGEIVSQKYKITECWIVVNDNKIQISKNSLPNSISIEELLKHANIFGEGIPIYRLSEDDIILLMNNYQQELNSSKTK